MSTLLNVIVVLILDEKKDTIIEYEMSNMPFIPHRGAFIDIDNGPLRGQFEIYDIEYCISQQNIEKNGKSGKANLKYIRVYAKKMKNSLQ